MLRTHVFIVLAILCASSPLRSDDSDGSAESLQGAWVGKTMEVDGTKLPKHVVANMRFTFKEDKLLVRGNFGNDREEECEYRLDTSTSPKQLDFTPPMQPKPILAIYEQKGDQLTVCMRAADGQGGRPTKFATKLKSKLVLLVMTREKPEADAKTN